jgi:hypothetical protein
VEHDHGSISEGVLMNDCGAAPERADANVTRLSSADDSGLSPMSVAALDIVDFEEVAKNEPLLDSCFTASGQVDYHEALGGIDFDTVPGFDETDSEYGSDCDDSVDGFELPIRSLMMAPGATDLEFLTRQVDCMDDASQALYAFEFKLEQAQCADPSMTVAKLYEQIARDEEAVLGQDAPVRIHVDGGSMATTTNRSDMLWHCRDISRGPVLKDAGDTKHYPIAKGFL